MKVGDKLLCKLNLCIVGSDDIITYFIKGKKYEIFFIGVQVEFVSEHFRFFLSNDKESSFYILNYFYTLEELRKHKLESI